MFKKIIVSALCGFLLTNNVAFVHAEEPNTDTGESTAPAVQGITVDYHSIEESRNYVNENGPQYLSPSYTTAPDTTNPPYAAGQLDDATLQDALKAVNTVRYIAGLDHAVETTADYNRIVQAGALVNALNGNISHKPDRPAGISDSLYTDGVSGNSQANLAYGFTTLASAVTNAWLNDGDESNVAVIGHRRWLLNAPMKYTGFGQVGKMTGMYAFNTKGSDQKTSNVWPAQNTPIEYFGKEYPWSVSTGKTETIDNIAVTLKNIKTGTQYVFSKEKSDGYFNVDNSGCGTSGAIIWRPDNVTYEDGDEYQVSISRKNEVVISYTVHFFSLYEQESMTINPTSLEIGVGETAVITASFLPVTSEAYVSGYSVTCTSNNPFSVAYGTDDKSLVITGKAVGYGTVTVKGSNGLTCECKINVINKTVPVTGIRLDQEELSLVQNETSQLTATVLPENATNKNVTWSSDNESVAAVDQNGLVTALKKGTAVIKVQSNENANLFDVCTVTVTADSDSAIIMRTASLSLEGYIGINFYISIPEDQQDDTVIVMSNNGKNVKTVEASEVEPETKDGITRQKFTYYVYSKQMRDKISLSVTDKAGNAKKLYTSELKEMENGLKYSVADYINGAQEYAPAETELLAMLEKMDAYGQWAQKCFDYNAKDLEPAEIKDVNADSLKGYDVISDGDIKSLNMTASLTLESGTDINFYFVLPKGEEISGYTITLDKNKAEAVKVSETEQGIKYRVSAENIVSKNLDKAHELIIEKDGTERRIEYSAFTYAYLVLKEYEDNAEYKNLVQTMKAMVQYQQAANAYFNRNTKD